MLKFLFADMGAEIVLVDIEEPQGIRRVVATVQNPLWETYCQAYTAQHPGSRPSSHGGTEMVFNLSHALPHHESQRQV